MNNKTTNKTKGALIPLLFFFYGSLRSGYWNNRLLHHATKIGPAATVSLWDLYVGRYGPVPCVVPNAKGRTLYGEVWMLNEEESKIIDRLEMGYTKGKTTVVTDAGQTYECVIYHAMDVKNAPYIGTDPILIESGDYSHAISPSRDRLVQLQKV